MAEPSAASSGPSPDDAPDPGDRGGLTVKERVADKIAVRAALDVPGVVRQGGGLSRLTGRELPRTLSVITDGAVAVGVHIAVAWPCSLARVADTVQRQVTDRLQTLVGLPVARVDVSIVAMVPPEESDLPPSTELLSTELLGAERADTDTDTDEGAPA